MSTSRRDRLLRGEYTAGKTKESQVHQNVNEVEPVQSAKAWDIAESGPPENKARLTSNVQVLEGGRWGEPKGMIHLRVGDVFRLVDARTGVPYVHTDRHEQFYEVSVCVEDPTWIHHPSVQGASTVRVECVGISKWPHKSNEQFRKERNARVKVKVLGAYHEPALVEFHKDRCIAQLGNAIVVSSVDDFQVEWDRD